MKIAMIGAAALAVTLSASRGEAGAILYNTTDLGGGFYKLQANSDGSIYGLTKSDGSLTYAFDKLPTTSIFDQTSGPTARDFSQTLTIENGGYKVGSIMDIDGSDNYKYNTSGAYSYASFGKYNSDWYVPGGGSIISPVSDINILGQIIGKGFIFADALTNPNSPESYYAAFSGIGARLHGGDSAISDNLNNYINPLPGVTLIAALEIDDLGRIIAAGSNGDSYLLTPLSLGTAATVPEPSTLVTLGIGILTVAVRGFKGVRNRDSKGLGTVPGRSVYFFGS